VLKNESTNVIIDFTKIDYIDSTGIGEMVVTSASSPTKTAS